MSGELYPQWYNSNDKGKYPFVQFAELTNGTVIIPDNLFADARLYPIGANQELFISSIVKENTTITFYFSDTVTTDLASTTHDLLTVPSVLRVTDKYGREAGALVTDTSRMSVFSGWPVGEQEFTIEQTQFCPTVITPMPANGVRSIRADEDEVLAGDVYIIGGRGVSLQANVLDPLEPVITVHAVGEPLFRRLLCSETGFTVPCFLETLEERYPDEYGNFYFGICAELTPNTLLRIEPISNGLKLYTVGGRPV